MQPSRLRSLSEEDFMDRQRDEGGAGQAFDGARNRFEQSRPAFDKPYQAFAEKDRQDRDGRKVSATPIIMVPANRMPAAGTPRAMANVITNRVSGHGMSPAITPTASPSCL